MHCVRNNTRLKPPFQHFKHTITHFACSFGFRLWFWFAISYLPSSSNEYSHTLRTHNSVSLSKFFFFFFFYFRVLFRSRRANENNAQKYANIMRVYKFANGGDEVFFIGDLGRKGRLIHYLLSTLFCSILR